MSNLFWLKKKPSDIAYKMQLDRFKVFKAQDQENGHFDCALEIGTKTLYCHKFVLATASVTFNSLLSKRWNKNNDSVIKVENPDYTYKSFYEFLRFIYSGHCVITKDNIHILTDMAEYYDVELLKEECEEFLLKISITFENLQEMFEFAQKYSFGHSLLRINVFIESYFMAIVNSDSFLNYQKNFIEHLSTTERDTVKEEVFFVAVCNWAEHQALKKKLESKNENFDVHGFTNTKLNEILSNINFSPFNYGFIKESVLSRKSIICSQKLYEIITKCNRNIEDEDECFKNLYEIAENEVKENMIANFDENIDLIESIKKELADFLPDINFHQMSIEFLMDFVVEKGFHFSFADLHEDLINCRKFIPEKAFTAVYELAEKHVLLKQQNSPDPNFNLIETVKTELSEVLSNIKFYKMPFTFLIEFVVEKGFHFSFANLHEDLINCRKFIPEKAFTAVYELAEKHVLLKQQNSPDPNFNLTESVKIELSEVLLNVKFYKMPFTFLIEFVVEKGIFLTPSEICILYSETCSSLNKKTNMENNFAFIYGFAEEQVLMRQKLSNDADLNVQEAIKNELSLVLQKISFHQMSYKFVMDFVVSNSIISEEEANHIFEICVKVENDDKKLIGAFKDIYGLTKAFSSIGYYVAPAAKNRVRFPNLKFTLPSTPSIVMKKNEVKWYLCFENDGIVAVKHQSLITGTDYLITEMKPDVNQEFVFKTNKIAHFIAKWKNI